jgi:hypothetical protein
MNTTLKQIFVQPLFGHRSQRFRHRSAKNKRQRKI